MSVEIGTAATNICFQFSVLLLCSVACQLQNTAASDGTRRGYFFFLLSIIPHRITNLEILVDTACKTMA